MIKLPVTIDLVINRLAEIQDIERSFKSEKAKLRADTLKALLASGVKRHITALGHTATTFDKVATKADKAYILSQLSEDQQLLAYIIVTSKRMKIT